jgi:gallate dioxygenase
MKIRSLVIHYGAIFFGLEKMAAVLKLSNADVYAQMRGESVEEFQKSRNVQMTYSVAGNTSDRDSR